MQWRKAIGLAAAFSLITWKALAAGETVKVEKAVRLPPIEMPEVRHCESAAAKYFAKHPHADPLKAGFFPAFGTATPLPPQTYLDRESGTIFYVESDGRHLTAIGRDGQLLWVRNPFSEQDLCPYRTLHPYIRTIASVVPKATKQKTEADMNRIIIKELRSEKSRGAKFGPNNFQAINDKSRFIWLEFNSSQDGYVNIANGDFYFQGQN